MPTARPRRYDWPPPYCAPANRLWARTSGAVLRALYFRRCTSGTCARACKPKAVSAAAHKLTRLIYTIPTKGQEYTDPGQEYCEQRYREQVLRQMSQRAQKMAMQLVPVELSYSREVVY